MVVFFHHFIFLLCNIFTKNLLKSAQKAEEAVSHCVHLPVISAERQGLHIRRHVIPRHVYRMGFLPFERKSVAYVSI